VTICNNTFILPWQSAEDFPKLTALLSQVHLHVKTEAEYGTGAALILSNFEEEIPVHPA
jgi:hypothetical protein